MREFRMEGDAMMTSLKFRRERNGDQRGGDVIFRRGAHWLRFALYIGVPPGHHFGVWRTRMGSSVRGVNVRVGRRHIKTLTILFHWR